MDKKPIFYIHIPKTSGNTIKQIYSEHNIYLGEPYWKDLKKKIPKYYDYLLKEKYYNILINFNNTNHHNIVIWHIPMAFWKDDIVHQFKQKYNIFCIVRNPYDRIVSDFKYWIKFYKNISIGRLKYYYKNLLDEVLQIYDNNFELSEHNLNRIITKLLSNDKFKYKLDGHLIPQYKYVFKKINDKNIQIPNYILKLENINNDFNKFKNKYSKFIKDDIMLQIHRNKSEFSLSKNSLYPETKKLIYKYYEKDFKYFDYK